MSMLHFKKSIDGCYKRHLWRIEQEKTAHPKSYTFKNGYLEMKEVQQQDSQIGNSSKKKKLKKEQNELERAHTRI